MKKLSMLAILILVAAGSAAAHEGSVGLYATLSHVACDEDITAFIAEDITIFYFRSDGGPDGITGAEFKIDTGGAMSGANYIEQPTTWPAGTLQLGTSVFSGISTVWTTECTGAGEDWIWIGTANVIWTAASPSYMLMVVPSPDAYDPSAVHVSICDEDKTTVNVLGGFYMACDPADTECSCNVGTKGSTWGAIKGMYR